MGAVSRSISDRRIASGVRRARRGIRCPNQVTRTPGIATENHQTVTKCHWPLLGAGGRGRPAEVCIPRQIKSIEDVPVVEHSELERHDLEVVGSTIARHEWVRHHCHREADLHSRRKQCRQPGCRIHLRAYARFGSRGLRVRRRGAAAAAVSRAGWATVGKSGRARQCEQQSGYDTGQETHAAATLGRLGCGQRLLISRIELTPPVVGTSAPRQEVFWRSLARTNHGSNTRRDV